jgi:hypothetical protein
VIRREEDIPFTFGFGGMGTVTVPKLIANTLNLHTPQEGRFALDHDIELDDNCYTGKDGNYDECVDFDPSPPILVISAAPSPPGDSAPSRVECTRLFLFE